MRNFNVLLIISSVIANAKCVGVRENGFEQKRFDLGPDACIESFDVHIDKIIRTQDSRAMGAKYLNEAEVGGREECTKLCCETPTCDVFVFEQKVPGSCYMFHCGPPEDFKCKFTQHRNYTSAVLAFNNRLGDIENRMKLTKHEEELNMLRKSDTPSDTTTILTAISTKVPASPAQPNKQNHSPRSQCSRYQFECRASGECIAIYNACDGIPQCSDGSDEAPELDCPTISGATHPKTFHDQLKSLKETAEYSPTNGRVIESSSPSEAVQQIKQVAEKPQPPRGKQPLPMSLGYNPYPAYSQQNEQIPETSHAKVEPPQQMANQPRYYGREGEIVQYPVNGMQWQGYQPQRHEDGSHIFNHKSSGLTLEGSDSQYPVSYGNDASRFEYMKYGSGGSGGGGGGNGGMPAPGNNGYYAGSAPVYYPSPNGWIQRVPQQPHGLEDVLQRPLLPTYGNGISGSVPSDYYYEDSQLRGRYPQVSQDLRRTHNSEGFHVNQNGMSSKVEIPQRPEASENSKKAESVKKALEKPTSTSMSDSENVKTTTSVSATESGEKKSNAGKEPERIAEHLKISDNPMKDVDGINERPSGAILSLTLGMCITAIMITLVGCRLRVVRRRMRRNGKSPYAHDADFLVNGMYL